MSIEQFIEEHQEVKKTCESLLATLKSVRGKITEKSVLQQIDTAIDESEKVMGRSV